MTQDQAERLVEALYEVCHAARLASIATDNLAPGYTDRRAWDAAGFAVELTEKLAREALGLAEAADRAAA